MWHQTPFQNWSWQRRHGFATQTRCCATNRYVGNTLQTRLFLSRHKHANGKWLASDAPLFIAPQTRRWKMAVCSRASFCCATNTRVLSGSLRTRLFLSRHKHADGKWLSSDAPVFIASQTLRWKMAVFRRAFVASQTLRWKMAQCDSKADALTPRQYSTHRASASGTRPVELPNNATGVWSL